MPHRVVYITVTDESGNFELRKTNILPTRAEMNAFFDHQSRLADSRGSDFDNLAMNYPKIAEFLGRPFRYYYHRDGRPPRLPNLILRAIRSEISWTDNGILIRKGAHSG